MADVQSNEASTQAHDTPSSANVGEKECFDCKKQFGASDHVLRLPCNHNCLTCLSEQEAEKPHTEQPTSGRQCKRDFPTIEMSVNSRTLLNKEEDGDFIEISLEPLFNYAKSAVAKFVALCTTFWHHFLTSSQSFWEVTKECLMYIFAVYAKIRLLVWGELQRLRSSTLFKETVPVIRNNFGSITIFVYHIIRKLFIDLPNDKPDTFEEVNNYIYYAILIYFLVGSLTNIAWLIVLASKVIYLEYQFDSLEYEEIEMVSMKPQLYLERVTTQSWHLYLLWLSLYYIQKKLQSTL